MKAPNIVSHDLPLIYPFKPEFESITSAMPSSKTELCYFVWIIKMS